MVSTKVTLSGWELSNPVIPASGTFGYGKEYSELYDINILGSFSFKGTTLAPRLGNPQPRIADGKAGIINSIGLENPGAKEVIEKKIPEMEEFFGKKVIANVSGSSIEDYAKICEMFSEVEKVGIIEVNVSCPNVKDGGMAFGTKEENVYKIAKAVKEVCGKPVYMKLSPNVTDIASMAKAAEEGGADGVCLINTLTGMRIDLKTKKPIIANKIAGYAGRGVFPVALAMVYKVFEAVKIPIIGCGGVESAEDVIEMMLAGATAVEVGTANLINPYCSKEIAENLPAVMQKYKIQNLKDIIGGAHYGN